MRETRSLVQEQVLHNDAFHGFERGLNVMRVGIRLRDVFTLDVKPFVVSGDRFVEHVRNTIAWFCVLLTAPCL